MHHLIYCYRNIFYNLLFNKHLYYFTIQIILIDCTWHLASIFNNQLKMKQLKQKSSLLFSIKSKNLSNNLFLYQAKSKATKDNINPHVIKAKYEVRGQIAIKSTEYKEALKKGEKFPFKKIYSLNIGNPQALNQKPISFPREVLSALFYPSEHANPDAVKRANTYLKEIGTVEHFTDFRGMSTVRKNVANYINKRDNLNDATEDDIILTNGAGGGIRLVLESVINSSNDAVMIPIPQYPLYTALLSVFDCHAVGYYLDEQKGWSIDVDSMNKAYEENAALGRNFKAFVVINPGNPIGNVLEESNIAAMIKFCYEKNLMILADEVYQNNIYNPKKKFHSFRSVLSKLPYPYNKTMLFSYNSVSKGVFGECGMRGGYMDMMNVPDEIKDTFYKLKVLDICPNISGQVITDVLVNPPTEETCSKETVEKFNKETEFNFENLRIKAEILSSELNKIEGISCQNIDGAMYAFPKINLPEWRVKQAKEKGVEPDAAFCLSLLDNTGIVSVPGSGFKQVEGTYHMRLTNLINPKEEMIEMVGTLKKFCEDYFKEGSKL